MKEMGNKYIIKFNLITYLIPGICMGSECCCRVVTVTSKSFKSSSLENEEIIKY